MIPKKLYCVTVVRGRTTKFFYGYKLKECFAHLKPGEDFTRAVYVHFGTRAGTFNGRTWTETQ